MQDKQQLDRELHRIAITVIIYNKKGQYLVTKRAPHKKVHPNKWTVPGGGLMVDDYIHTKQTYKGQWYGAVENALQREIREEVNIKIGEPKYLLDIAFIRPDNIPVIVLSYYAPFISGNVKIDEDTVESRWVTLAEAKKLDLIEGIFDEIKMVEKILKGKKK